MSANTSITEGGKARPFGPVKALMVQGEDGKYYPWFPESDRALGTLSVDKNGIYRASDKGVYGWSSVIVNVPQTDSVTGRDPQTGQEVTVTADPETGELVETVVPVEIRVITPPTNPYGVYVDGQTITKDGMVVKAYDANGDEMQTVPIGEITINPTTAVYDSSKDSGAIYSGDGVTAMLVSCATPAYWRPDPSKPDDVSMEGWIYPAGLGNDDNGRRCTPISLKNSQPSAFLLTKYNGYVYGVCRGGSPSLYDARYTEETLWYYWGATFGLMNSTQFRRGDTVNVLHWSELPLSAVDPSTVDPANLIETTPAGVKQTITVSWPRPGNGAILDTTFDILVGPRSGQGDD